MRQGTRNKKQKGQLSIQVLVFSAVALILIGAFSLWGASFLRLSVRDLNKAQAFASAEAGIEYYRWHLAHSPKDFQDGTGHAGPYTHLYFDKDGEQIGEFILDITAPPLGSTVVTIKSTGHVVSDSSIQKIIQIQ